LLQLPSISCPFTVSAAITLTTARWAHRLLHTVSVLQFPTVLDPVAGTTVAAFPTALWTLENTTPILPRPTLIEPLAVEVTVALSTTLRASPLIFAFAIL